MSAVVSIMQMLGPEKKAMEVQFSSSDFDSEKSPGSWSTFCQTRGVGVAISIA